MGSKLRSPLTCNNPVRRRFIRRAALLGASCASLLTLGMRCEPDVYEPPLSEVGPDLRLDGPTTVCLGDTAEITWSITDVSKHYVSLNTNESCGKCVLEKSLLQPSSTPVFETSPDEARTGSFFYRCLEPGSGNVHVDMTICRTEENCDKQVGVDKYFTVACVRCDDAGTDAGTDASTPLDASADSDTPDGGSESELTGWVVPDDESRTSIGENEKPNPAPDECTPLSDDSQCEKPKGPQQIATVLDPILELSETAVTRLFSETFSCGEHDGYHVLCGSETPTAGSWVYLFTRFAADVPLSGTQILQYAFVFDADDDPNNGWEPAAAFPKDFFADTDLWYEALYAPGSGWSLQVRDARADLAAYPTAARLIIAGSEFGILVPLSDFDTATPTFRTSAFAHEGDYGLSGGPWSGDYLPTLDDPLMPVATDVVITVDE